MDNIFVIIAFAAGLVVAGVAAGLVAHSRQRLLKVRLAEQKEDAERHLAEQKAEAEARLAAAREEAQDRLEQQKAEVAAQAAAAREDYEKRLEQRKVEADERLAKEREEQRRASDAALKALQERSDAALKAQQERSDAALKTLQERFDETIAKVSAQVKTDTSEMLKARQKEFSETSGQSIGQILNPLKDNIAELRKTLEQGGKEQAERQGEMREQIKGLMQQSDATRKSADELAAALKHGTKVQGDWGETVLDELLASQGLTKGVHYDTQSVVAGGLRPDVILHLDERREVIIDSKVSLTAYIDYVNAEDEASRARALKQHLESIRKHVKELAEKDYTSLVQPPKVSAGYVLMFVPNVGALWTALNAEPDLWRKAADSNGYITDEQSLYGALKIVSLTWTQVARARNHERVYELASEIIDRVGQFQEHYEAMGKALDKARTEFDAGRRKLDPGGQSILNSSRKLLKLGAKDSDKHPVKPLLDVSEEED